MGIKNQAKVYISILISLSSNQKVAPPMGDTGSSQRSRRIHISQSTEGNELWMVLVDNTLKKVKYALKGLNLNLRKWSQARVRKPLS